MGLVDLLPPLSLDYETEWLKQEGLDREPSIMMRYLKEDKKGSNFHHWKN